MKILLPVDLVHPVEPIADLLSEFSNLSLHDLRLLYVRELLPSYESVIKTSGTFSDDWEQKLEARAKEHLTEYAQKLRPNCKSVTYSVAHGPVASTIAEVATDEQQDLVVVAPGHHSAAERILSGSVAARVLDQTDRSVLVARPTGNKTDLLKNVLIGTDGSESSRMAIERAAAIFRIAQSQAKVTVVHSVDVAEPVKFLSPVEFVASIEQNLLMVGETYLAQAEKLLADSGVKNIDCCLIEGNPAMGMLKMASDLGADLVIIGSQGHGKLHDLLLGSVSRKIAMHAGCSVAVMKARQEQ